MRQPKTTGARTQIWLTLSHGCSRASWTVIRFLQTQTALLSTPFCLELTAPELACWPELATFTSQETGYHSAFSLICPSDIWGQAAFSLHFRFFCKKSDRANCEKFQKARETTLLASWKTEKEEVETMKPVLNWANVCSPNILRTLRRNMIRFLIELLVRGIWFGQSKLYFVLNWLVMRCKLRPELAADAQQTAWSKM